jgi:hypothetical protein
MALPQSASAYAYAVQKLSLRNMILDQGTVTPAAPVGLQVGIVAGSFASQSLPIGAASASVSQITTTATVGATTVTNNSAALAGADAIYDQASATAGVSSQLQAVTAGSTYDKPASDPLASVVTSGGGTTGFVGENDFNVSGLAPGSANYAKSDAILSSTLVSRSQFDAIPAADRTGGGCASIYSCTGGGGDYDGIVESLVENTSGLASVTNTTMSQTWSGLTFDNSASGVESVFHVRFFYDLELLLDTEVSADESLPPALADSQFSMVFQLDRILGAGVEAGCGADSTLADATTCANASRSVNKQIASTTAVKDPAAYTEATMATDTGVTTAGVGIRAFSASNTLATAVGGAANGLTRFLVSLPVLVPAGATLKYALTLTINQNVNVRSVPEPATLALFGATLVLVGAAMRRRSRDITRTSEGLAA